MKDFAIYTAIVGDYDTIRQPLVVDERFDYFLFSNDIHEKQIGVWQVRPIPYHNDIQTKIARWVKTHPQELLAGYTYSLWMDANIQINTSTVYNQISSLISEETMVASLWHHERDCIYSEAIEVLAHQIEHELPVYRWISILKREHYPRHQGLFETGVLFRQHNKPIVQKMDNLWWQCIERYSRRDQLSFSYSLWKNHLDCKYLLPIGENARNSTAFNYITHSKGGIVDANRQDDPFLNYYLKKYPDTTHDRLFKIHRRLLRFPFSVPLLLVFGQYYRILNVVNPR